MDDAAAQPEPLTKQDFEALARFRFAIRAYLRFSEDAVRAAGLTPQQYQLLLALKGFPGRDWASVRELADRLLLRHHSVVELVGRAQNQGLVQRSAHPSDGRAVRVALAPAGERVLTRLGTLHRDELRRMDTAILPPEWESASPSSSPEPSPSPSPESEPAPSSSPAPSPSPSPD
ncbi:MarR family winged helix-turn-helix transcriptional regulator [Nonomuraea fuscirosea]|uniref:MarR family winged helix-turn-helix transcriptional regulator n=1 Tax=Nonomuraea fuscirosea TaxID=1291556 RepID=UPI0037102FED